MCTMTMSKLLYREDTKGWRALAKMGKISRVWLFFSVLKWNKVDFSCLDISKTGKRRSVEQSLRSMVLLIKAERCFEGFMMFSNNLIVFRTWLKELFWILMSGHKKWNRAWRGGIWAWFGNLFFYESRCLQYIDIFLGTNTKMNYASYHFLGEMSLSHVWTFVPDDLQNRWFM